MLNTTSRLGFHQKGVGLVELMIAIVLGMLVVGSALALYASSFGTNAASQRVARLNNDLRAIMTFVTRDLRRAGYSGTAAGGFANPFDTITLTGNTAIQFAYDADSDGVLDANENFGYRLSNNAVQITTDGGTSWENISDPDRITITKFQITDNSPGPISMGTTTVVNVQSRRFTITLEGTISSGAQTYTRVIEESVRVRNEGVT
jgi:prepilin peptidase dependent protein B